MIFKARRLDLSLGSKYFKSFRLYSKLIIFVGNQEYFLFDDGLLQLDDKIWSVFMNFDPKLFIV